MPRYSYPTNNTLAGLIQDQGRIRAQQAYAHGQSGQIWANAIGNVGQIAGRAIEQHGLRKEEEKEKAKTEEAFTLKREATSTFLQNPEAPESYQMLVSTIGQDDADKVVKGAAAFKVLMDKNTPPEEAQLTLPQLYDGWEAGGKDPKVWRTVVNTYGTKMGQKIGPEWWQPTEKNVSQVKAMVDQLRPKAAEPKMPTVGSFEDVVVKKHGPQATPEQILAARGEYAAAGRAPEVPEPEMFDASTALKLTNSLKSHPAYTDMQDIETGMQGVLSGLSQKDGFGDITAINSFQRMVDPGATVRSEDVVLLQSASSIIQRILSEYPIERLTKGAKLPESVRQQMRKTSEDLYRARAKGYNEKVGAQYRKLAEAAGFDYELIGQDFGGLLNKGQAEAPPGGDLIYNPETGQLEPAP